MFAKVILICGFLALASARTPRTAQIQLAEGPDVKEGAVLPYPVLKKLIAENGYEAVLVPSIPKTEIGFSVLNGVSYIISNAVVIVKNIILVVLQKLPALLVGTVVMLGVCKFTNICHKLAQLKNLSQLQEELNSFASPERLARAADFVQQAVEKFSAMQN